MSLRRDQVLMTRFSLLWSVSYTHLDVYKRQLRRRPTAVPAGEVVDAELVDAGAAAAEPVADAGSDDAGVAEPEPATKARRPRRDRVAAAPVAEAEPAVEPAGDEAVEGAETAGCLLYTSRCV